jgi:hypothetical protein
MVSDPSRHCWGDSQGAMNAAEVIVGEIQRDSRLEGRQLFREGRRQAIKPLECKAHGQVVALDIRDTGAVSRGLPCDRRDLYATHLWRAVSPWPRIVSRVGLDQRGVMHVVPKGLFNAELRGHQEGRDPCQRVTAFSF